MRGCPELRKLPKAPRISSLFFLRQTPGSAATVALPGYHAANQKSLDPKHPFKLSPRKRKGTGFIWALNQAFSLGAAPQGLLAIPQDPPPRFAQKPFDSWANRVARGADTGTVAPMILNERPNRLSMSFQMMGSRYRSNYQRTIISRRFKSALNLIVTRGADAKEVKGRLQIVLDDEQATDDWILHGWSYFLKPTLELYRMPLPELVSLIRPALRTLQENGAQLEAQWAAETIRPTPPPVTRNARLGHVELPSTQESSNYQKQKKKKQKNNKKENSSNLGRRLDPLSAVPDFDPFPSAHAGPSVPRSDPSAAGIIPPNHGWRLDPLPAVPDFDPFPSARAAPSTPTSDSLAAGAIPPNRGRTLTPVSDFDPFPSAHAAPSAATSNQLVAGPNRGRTLDPLPLEPDFDPFPSAHAAPSVPTSDPLAVGASAPAPAGTASPPKPSPVAKRAKNTNWWAIGRTLEAGIGQVTEGPTRWDRPMAAEPSVLDTTAPSQSLVGADTSLPGQRKTVPRTGSAAQQESVQDRLKGMLSRRYEVARPDSKDRAAGKIPWQTHRLEVK
ncbi:hypothetical protein C8R44DRAFT_65428 [Mycena epipterygia]|nr:hypothetical protein C8R44DRAFT_65428 [Mycena epipterygia]